MQHINIQIKPVVHKKIHKMHLHRFTFSFYGNFKEDFKVCSFFIIIKIFVPIEHHCSETTVQTK